MSWLTSDRIAEARDYVAWWYRQWPKPLSASGSDFDAAEIATTLDMLSDWLEERQIDASPLRNFNRQHRSELVDSVLNLLERAEREIQKSPEQKAPPQASTPPVCDHSDDFRSVIWFGRTYVFSANEAICVRALWDHWKRGTPDVAADTLLAAIDHASPPRRLQDVFRGNPAWGEFIVTGGTKGTQRLNDQKK